MSDESRPLPRYHRKKHPFQLLTTRSTRRCKVVDNKVVPILSTLMASPFNWLARRLWLVHDTPLSSIALASLRRIRSVCPLRNKAEARVLENWYPIQVPFNYLSLFIVKIKWHRLYWYRLTNMQKLFRRLIAEPVWIEGKLCVIVKGTPRIIMTKLRTSSARALLRRRFHTSRVIFASRNIVHERGLGAAMWFMSRSVRLLCQPVSALAAALCSFHMRIHCFRAKVPSRTHNAA